MAYREDIDSQEEFDLNKRSLGLEEALNEICNGTNTTGRGEGATGRGY